MLDIAYHPDVPRAMIDFLEHHGRRLGVSLDALERIGQSLDLVEAFIVACEAGRAPEFVATVGLWESPSASAPARVEAAKPLG